MKLPDERAVRLARRWALGLVVIATLGGCGSHERLDSASTVPALRAANGPAADYPVVIGAPYRVDTRLYTPADTMNYDEVGYVAADGGSGVTGSHHTLPLPSYVEITSLQSGRTILVRLERRGPMTGDAVVGLSSPALAQLGLSAGDPVRVRRVNPPEEERVALRAGRSAPLRMDTPASLVAVLKRKLPEEGSAILSATPSAAPTLAAVKLAASSATPGPLPSSPASAAQVLARSAPANVSLAAPRLVANSSTPQSTEAEDGRYIVQAAAMSTVERAHKVASAIGGSVSKSGQYYRVRTGPFATRQQAEASLAKVRAAGYSDARILNNG
jgi:rare lipoprotein A